MASNVAQSFFGFFFRNGGLSRRGGGPIALSERTRVLDGTMLLLMPGGQL